MSGIHSFSHRQNERKLELRTIDKHRFPEKGILSHMFHNFPLYVELGGLLGIAYLLRTDTSGGLRQDEESSEYGRRRELFMTNEYPLPPVRPMLTHLAEAFADGMLKILILAGVVSIVASSVKHPTDGWVEGFAILVCVFIVAYVSAYNNHKQEVAYQELASSLKGSKVSVVRGGKELSIDPDLLLVGDIVRLNPGSMVPADGLVIDQTSVRVNESSITGESDERIKNFYDPYLSAGTELVDGTCSMLVTAVGVNSAKGKIMSSLARKQEYTKLQIRLAAAEKLAAYIGFVCGCGTFLALLISFFASNPDYNAEWDRIVEIFIISITVVIVAIPEGLPLAVTVSMAYSMAKMRADQNLVKVLSACETMGNATAICSDKTGTLTQNKMTVVQAYVGGRFFSRQAKVDELTDPVHNLLVEAVVLNSDRRVQEAKMDFAVAPEDWKWEGDGGATEAALLAWLSRYHEPPKRNIMQLRFDNRERIVHFYPFSSAKKFSSVIIADPDPSIPEGQLPSKGRQYYKGAADRIIARCTKMVGPDGKVVRVGSLNTKDHGPGHGHDANAKAPGSEFKINDESSFSSSSSITSPKGVMCSYVRNGEPCDRWAVVGPRNGAQAGQALYCNDPNHLPRGSATDGSEFVLVDQHPMRAMDNMARLGLRCIAFAYIDDVKIEIKDGQLVDPAEATAKAVAAGTATEPEWTLIGLVGIKDPLRVETRGAVMTVQQAGIIVRMVTGDNLETARYIAKDCGIITHPRHIAIEGTDFRAMLEKHEAWKAAKNEDLPEFVELVKNLRVMARCQPEDKLELVKFLKEHGEVVGVTGDGSNDGPALKTADVGLAMGIAGTDVAKAAAHIIILDDNFSSIVRSVMWGRSVFDNIRKFLQFQCSVNFCALVVALVGAIGTGKEPLKPIQLLWVNLVMDTMGALAIGTEVPKPTLLMRKPYHPDSPLISKIMWRNIVGQGAFQLAILMPLLFLGQDMFPELFHRWVAGKYVYWEDKHFTFIFNVFVWLQLFNEINSRKCNDEVNVFVGILDNAWFVSIFIITSGLQAMVVELFGSFTQTTPQDWQLWLVAIALGASQLVTGLLLRLWVPDPTEGQVKVDPSTFENAPWIDDPSLLGAMFRAYQTKDMAEKEADGGAGAQDVVGLVKAQEAFCSPFEDEGRMNLRPMTKPAGAATGATDDFSASSTSAADVVENGVGPAPAAAAVDGADADTDTDAPTNTKVVKIHMPAY